MQVRRLVPEDASLYRSIMLHAYDTYPDAFTSSAAERSKESMEWWKSRIDSRIHANEIVFGAWVNRKLIGVAGISFQTREKLQHKAMVFGMYVDQNQRGAGVGHQLLNSLLDEARGREGVRIVQLTVTEGNIEAEKLYSNVGFKRFGIEPLAVRVSSTYVSKVHMWYELSAMTKD